MFNCGTPKIMQHHHNIDSSLWLTFLAVAEHGSFSQAAAQLHISQPAISKRIRALEQQLGFDLFDRIAGRIVLSARGAQLLPAAQQLKRSLADIHNLAFVSDMPPQGRLSLGLSHYCGLHLLNHTLSQFSQRYPNIMLDLRFADSEQIISEIAAGDLALGYATLPPRVHAAVTTTPLRTEQLIALIAPRHLDNNPTSQVSNAPASALELASQLPCILPAAGTSTRNSIEQWLDAHKVNPAMVIEINQLDSIAALARTGVGWAILPETFLDAGLTQLPINHQVAATRVLGRIEPQNRASNPLANAFMSFANQAMALHPQQHEG